MDQHGTADGVPAEQGALGSAQHLHPVNVHEIDDVADGAGHIDAIDIQADPGVGHGREVSLANAADEDHGRRA